MNLVLEFSFALSLLVYLGIAAVDIRYHFKLDGTPDAVGAGETVLHLLAGTLVTTILSTLLFHQWMPLTGEERKFILSICPVFLMAVGLSDEVFYHRPRCRNDAKENWHHAVLHFSMGSSLLLGYVRWL